jgi:hypothetical protein
LVPSKPAVTAIFFLIGRLDVAAEIAAINLSGFAFTADDTW